MNDAGDPGAAIGSATAERLRAHAAGIVVAAGVPARTRTDVTEELVGHLVERTRAAIAAGLTEANAADQAIGAFGGVDELATDLSGAFHSRLWASTIGVLLPAVAVRDDRPGIIGWLRFALAIGMALIVIGLAMVIWQATPVHVLLAIGALGLGLAGLALAFRALARGQRWALWYAIAYAVELVVFGAISVIAPEVPGSLTIPLGALLGLGVLLGVRSAWDRLQAFVAASPPIGRALGAMLAASLLGPPLLSPALAALPDPTQAHAEDLRMLVSVTCDRGDVVEPNVPTRRDIQRVTIVADMEWRRGDVLPNGLNGLFNPSHFGDTAGFRLEQTAMDGPLPDWLLVPREPAVVDRASGAAAGWFGSTSPSVELIPNTIGSFTVGIDLGAIQAGRTLRATWLLTPASDAARPWPTIEVAYAHLDRFLLIADAGCGETDVGREVPLRPPRLVEQRLDPIDFMIP